MFWPTLRAVETSSWLAKGDTHPAHRQIVKAGVHWIGSLLANILVTNAELLLSSVESFLRCEQVISRYTNPFLPQLKHACNIPQIVRQQN
jgi:hypothetical protein